MHASTSFEESGFVFFAGLRSGAMATVDMATVSKDTRVATEGWLLEGGLRTSSTLAGYLYGSALGLSPRPLADTTACFSAGVWREASPPGGPCTTAATFRCTPAPSSPASEGPHVRGPLAVDLLELDHGVFPLLGSPSAEMVAETPGRGAGRGRAHRDRSLAAGPERRKSPTRSLNVLTR